MTQQLGGGGVQIEEGDGGLAGHQELSGYGWVTADGRATNGREWGDRDCKADRDIWARTMDVNPWVEFAFKMAARTLAARTSAFVAPSPGPRLEARAPGLGP